MNSNFHTRLKSLRTNKGLTIQQVSNLTKIPASTYKEWENGRQIRGEPYVHLAKVFGISLHELLTGEKSKATPALQKIDEIELMLRSLKEDLVSF